MLLNKRVLFVSLALLAFLAFGCSTTDGEANNQSDNGDGQTDDGDGQSGDVGAELLLTEFDEPSLDPFYFSYNSDNRITQMQQGQFAVNYEYLSDGRREQVYTTASHYSHQVSYEYENDEMSKIVYMEDWNFRDSTDWDYTFTSTDSADLIYSLYPVDGTDPMIISYSADFVLDAQGQLTSFQLTNTDTEEETTYTFEYSSNNLTKVVDNNSNTWEIEYDNKKSFLTYHSDFARDFIQSGGLTFYHLDYDLYQLLRKTPMVNAHMNSNNPTSVKYNGKVITTFQYEYNNSDYPFEVWVAHETISPFRITMEYTAAN